MAIDLFHAISFLSSSAHTLNGRWRKRKNISVRLPKWFTDQERKLHPNRLMCIDNGWFPFSFQSCLLHHRHHQTSSLLPVLSFSLGVQRKQYLLLLLVNSYSHNLLSLVLPDIRSDGAALGIWFKPRREREENHDSISISRSNLRIVGRKKVRVKWKGKEEEEEKAKAKKAVSWPAFEAEVVSQSV